jgi:hypothetical protein
MNYIVKNPAQKPDSETSSLPFRSRLGEASSTLDLELAKFHFVEFPRSRSRNSTLLKFRAEIGIKSQELYSAYN